MKIAVIFEAIASIAKSAVEIARLIRDRRIERKREEAERKKTPFVDTRTQVGRKS